MKNSRACKHFFLFIIFILIYTTVSADNYEEKIKNNFKLSDQLKKLSDEIKIDEQSFLDRIKNLKIKLYTLELEKDKLSEISEKSSEFYEEKIKKYKSIILELESIKKKTTRFFKKRFFKKKRRTFQFF
jgi:DNA-binding Lrp family transcriptional regulator